MIATPDRFEPRRDGIEPAERLARLRGSQGRHTGLAAERPPAMMVLIAAVEPARPAVLEVATATTVPAAVAVCWAPVVVPTRTTVAISSVVRPAVPPRIGMEAGATSASHELDHRITADLFERKGSGIRRGRQTKPGGYFQHLHARHDLNLVGARHRFQPAGEIEGCASAAEPMLTRGRAIRSATTADRLPSAVRAIETRTVRYAGEMTAGGAQTLTIAAAAIECHLERTAMKRPLTTSLASPPPDQPQEPKAEPAEASPPPATWRETAPIVAALGAILSAMESGPKVGPAVKAYRSAIRRHGQDAAAIGGSDAMEAVLRRVVDAAPDQAGREAALTDAWAGLPGWRV